MNFSATARPSAPATPAPSGSCRPGVGARVALEHVSMPAADDDAQNQVIRKPEACFSARCKKYLRRARRDPQPAWAQQHLARIRPNLGRVRLTYFQTSVVFGEVWPAFDHFCSAANDLWAFTVAHTDLRVARPLAAQRAVPLSRSRSCAAVPSLSRLGSLCAAPAPATGAQSLRLTFVPPPAQRFVPLGCAGMSVPEVRSSPRCSMSSS